MQSFTHDQERFVSWCNRRTRPQLIDLLHKSNACHMANTAKLEHWRLVELMMIYITSNNVLMDLYIEATTVKRG